MKINFKAVGFLCFILAFGAHAEKAFDFAAPSERNVIYGMDHGAALLMDIYKPDAPNGYGVVFIMGTGFTAYGEYNDVPLKQLDRWLLESGVFPEIMGEKGPLFGPMLDAGFTVFSINHRLGPKHTIWTQVRDCQRAVQFIRYHADLYGISSERIGGLGHSSGATMIAFLGLAEEVADADAFDPVGRVSSRLQAVVPVSGLFDFIPLVRERNWMRGFLGSIVGRTISYQPPGHPVYDAFKEASPIHYVTPDDAPVLLLHGTEDAVVPLAQSAALAEALKEAEVPYEYIPLEGADHGVLLEPVNISPGSYAAEWMANQLIR